ncbi:hypothetical protein BpHYR1_002245 [Brachionus plicatilis]|uniref:Uncharacterized protein n=1 Tax=Brachionus plicatilis TaxID=10195 RepID=A0A3M7S5A7_BRAPC|nr:hypothetical protein BpHYR1_002245 [Brachionus plicatilis]
MITKQYVISADGQSGYLVARGDEINDDHKFYIEARNFQEEIKLNEVEKINRTDKKPDKTRYCIVRTSTTPSTPNTSSCSIS